MSLTNKLVALEDKGAFPKKGTVIKRWGQLIRENPSITAQLSSLLAERRIQTLQSLGVVKSGVVTRANAFFIVRELTFDSIPKRFDISRRDYKTVTVVMDGLETPHRIERRYLRKLIKGPESLLSPEEIEDSSALLVDVTDSKDALRELHANGALSYLRRGETVAFNVSDDTLKGGIPALRSQVKNRKPYWYSLNTPAITSSRIALPEHFDRRYIATLIPADNNAVVIDTLYSFTASDVSNTELIWAELNSLLTWYQIELRGRTQHGQGVLKVKIPDYGGILVGSPAALSVADKQKLLSAFRKISGLHLSRSLDVVSTPDRVAFDTLYLKLLGFANPEGMRLDLERELRSAINERQERKLSVVDAKVERKKTSNVAASVDAFASRVAASMEQFPDPRVYLNSGISVQPVVITAPIEGSLTVGVELFNQGEILSGNISVARARTILAAQFVRAVLMRDPALDYVNVPEEEALQHIMSKWRSEADKWRLAFDKAFESVAQGVRDDRTKEAIRLRALELLHAT